MPLHRLGGHGTPFPSLTLAPPASEYPYHRLPGYLRTFSATQRAHTIKPDSRPMIVQLDRLQ